MAGEVGGAVWLPLLVALGLALLTAGSYAELVTKYPQAGGAAVFAERAFTVRERREALRRAQESGSHPSVHLAARWAAKEALVKAWSQAANAVAARAVAPVIAPEAVMWQHIEVVTDRWGRPGMRLSSRVAQAIDDSLGAGACDPGRWAVSLTHEGDWAAAIVLCLGPGPGERAGGRG